MFLQPRLQSPFGLSDVDLAAAASRSWEEKLGEGLGTLLHHGPEMVDSVSM